MIQRRTLLTGSLSSLVLIGSCAGPAGTAGAPPAPSAPGPAPAFDDVPADPHSYARPNEARVTHVNLDLRADFARRVLSGAATLDIAARPGATEIVLDTRDLTIQSVRVDGREARFTLGAAEGTKGAPLVIPIAPETRRVVVAYETSPDAGALQWLTPAQTSGPHPFLFSQGQAILTRTWIPTQDSPGVRQTYEARIVAPEGLRAVMSAEALTPDGEAVSGGRAFRFRMTHAIPCYLIAIGVGDIAFRSLGPRSGVYAEPAVLARAANEFVDIERMISVTEALYGPYRWGRYDVLVLPPSFPYGGMENPTLTFATPTILAGDRSLVELIAHELAHSWSGNLVTNATWADFWLNESFTSYIEGRIVEALYGEERAVMNYALAWVDIQNAVRTLPPQSTTLHFESSDADGYSSAIAYDKGAAFLRTIERIAGRERFDAYLRSYFDRHAFQPMTSAGFLADIRQHLVQGDAELEAALQLDAWVYQAGLPNNVEEPRSEAFARVDAAAAAFAGGGRVSSIPWNSWSTLERQRFLRALPRELPDNRLLGIENAFALNQTGNSEIMFDWLTLAVANRYEAAVPTLEQFLTTMGRRKFVLPLFTQLMAQGEWGEPIARRIYAVSRPTYHPVTYRSVDAVMA